MTSCEYIIFRRVCLFLFIFGFTFFLTEASPGRQSSHHHRHHPVSKDGGNKTTEVVYKRSKQHALKGLFSLHSNDPLCSNSALMETLSKKKRGLTFLRRRCSNSLESENGPTRAHLRSRRKSRVGNNRKNKAKEEKVYTKIASLIEKTNCQAIKGLHEIENPTPLLEKYMPCNVPVKRCAGCCLSELEECVPAKVKYRKFKVLKQKKFKPLSTAVESVAVEEHLKCECRCKTKASDCGAGQIYEEENCVCKCPAGSHTSCPQTKVWNEGECKCICRNIKECTTTMVFNPETCSCQQKQPYLGGLLYDELS